MLVSGGEDIRVFERGAAPIVVAQDRRANPSSPFVTIDNGVAFNDVGQVAFVAKVENRRGVFRTDGTTTTRIATQGEAGIAEIAWFTPALDAAGTVVFKGEDTEGKNAIWVGDGKSLERLVTAGDALPSDKGAALALPEVESDPHNRVTFGGAVVMNARGDIAFSASLAQQGASGTTRLGTGIYVAVRSR
jgi:hypothetical protein